MKVTRTLEVRIVENVRYVHVDNVAVLGFSTAMVGPGRIKVVKLAKGGYTVRPLGKFRGFDLSHRDGTAVLRVDAHSTTLAGLFADQTV